MAVGRVGVSLLTFITLVTSFSFSGLWSPVKGHIEWNNNYWQVLKNDSQLFYLCKAFLDQRHGEKYVRIPAISYRKISPKIFCHMKYQHSGNDETETVTAELLNTFIWSDQPYYGVQPFLISCPITFSADYIMSVSLSFNRDTDDYSNEFMVSKRTSNKSGVKGHIEENKNIAVCLKYLNYYYTDISYRLIEWIEMIKILNGSHIFFTILDAHPNMLKILEHYSSTGFISVTNFTLPGNQPNEPKKRFRYLNKPKNLHVKMSNEMISLYDCMYRSIENNYNYIAMMDIDEMIIPIKYSDWKELLSGLENGSGKNIDQFEIIRTYFTDTDTNTTDPEVSNVPKYMHMMRHIYTDGVKIGKRVMRKGFINLNSNVIAINNHKARFCDSDTGEIIRCEGIKEVDSNIAIIGHYRTEPKYLYPDRVVKKNTVIWKYRNILEHNMNNTLKRLDWL